MISASHATTSAATRASRMRQIITEHQMDDFP